MTDFYLLPPGLIAVTGPERSGKTSLLRRLCGNLHAMLGEAAVHRPGCQALYHGKRCLALARGEKVCALHLNPAMVLSAPKAQHIVGFLKP